MARVSPRTIDRAIASGQLRASKVNGGRRVRIHRTWLTAWLLGSVFLVLGLCRSERVDRWCQSVKRGRYGQRLAKLAAILFSATAILFGLAYVGNWDPAQRAVMSLGFASADLGEQLQDPVEAKPAAAAEARRDERQLRLRELHKARRWIVRHTDDFCPLLHRCSG